MQYNVLEARNQLSKLFDAAAAGEEVVIAKRVKPFAKIVPIDDVRSTADYRRRVSVNLLRRFWSETS